MIASQILLETRKHIREVVNVRNIGVFAPMLQKATDPIQQLFIEKLREYKEKSAG